jgi:MFS family permease
MHASLSASLRAVGPRLASRAVTTFASLGERDFRWYAAGNVAFFMAMQMQFVLRGYLAYDLTQSAWALGIIGAAISLPMLIVAPIGGVVADRVNKKHLLVVTQLAAALASVVVSVLIFGEWLVYWHLLAVSLFTGVMFSFNMPARSAIAPLLVPQHKLMNAISLQMGGMNFTRIIAPALAGLLIAPMGAGGVYLLTTVLFMIAVCSEFQLPRHGLTGSVQRASGLHAFRDGLRYVRTERIVGLLVLTNLLMPLFSFPVHQLLPVFAVDVFGVGAPGLGILTAMTGLGGIVGALVAANLDHHPAKGRIMFGAGIGMSVSLGLFALAPTFPLAMGCLALAGVGQMLFTTANNTVIQARVPEDLRGRVNSLVLMSVGVMPLGVLPLTAIADVAGAQVTVAGSSTVLLLVVVMLFALVKPLRDLRMAPLVHAELSRVQAAGLVAAGKLTREEADRRSGAGPQAAPDAGATRS